MGEASAEIDHEIALGDGGSNSTAVVTQSEQQDFPEEFAHALPQLYPDHPVNRAAS